MGRYQSGQMGRTVNPLLRLRRFESFSPHQAFLADVKWIFGAGKLFSSEWKIKCGSSSVGRAAAFQAAGRGFEPRLPLHKEQPGKPENFPKLNLKSCCSSGVEHFLGKEEVESSILFNSSNEKMNQWWPSEKIKTPVDRLREQQQIEVN